MELKSNHNKIIIIIIIIIAKNFFNLVKGCGEVGVGQEGQQIQRAEPTLNRKKRTTKKSIPRHIRVKLLKTKDNRNLESSQREWTHCDRVKISSNNSVFLTGDHRSLKEVAQSCLRAERKELATQNAIPSEKRSFRNEGETKAVSGKKQNKTKLREFVASKPTLKEQLGKSTSCSP